jgi:hypothetical protein
MLPTYYSGRQLSEEELVDLPLAMVTINGWNRLSIAFSEDRNF